MRLKENAKILRQRDALTHERVHKSSLVLDGFLWVSILHHTDVWFAFLVHLFPRKLKFK